MLAYPFGDGDLPIHGAGRQRKYREANREKIREATRKYRQGGLVEKAKRKRA